MKAKDKKPEPATPKAKPVKKKKEEDAVTVNNRLFKIMDDFRKKHPGFTIERP